MLLKHLFAILLKFGFISEVVSEIMSLDLTRLRPVFDIRQCNCWWQLLWPFNGPMSGTTRVSQYQKKHSPTFCFHRLVGFKSAAFS